MQLIHAFRSRGHLVAKIDPLGQPRAPYLQLDPTTYGLTEADLDRVFLVNNVNEHGAGNLPRATLRDILDRMRRTYCGTLACEYMYMQNPAEKLWLQSGWSLLQLLAAGERSAGAVVGTGRASRRVRAFPAYPVYRAQEFCPGRRGVGGRDSGRIWIAEVTACYAKQ